MRHFSTALFGSLLWFPWLASGGGVVVGWGGNEVGQIDPCAPNVVAISAGSAHSLLLLEDGTVADCGMFEPYPYYPITVPAGLSNVVAVAAGDFHSLALKADGTVVAWGLNGQGQTNVPAGLTNVAAIAAGARHSLALKTDGTLVRWGEGGTNIPSGISNVVAISAGINNNLVLNADGSVSGWGFRADQTAAFLSVSNIVAISAGDDWNYESWLALKSNGEVVSAGAYSGVRTVQSNAIAISCSRGTDHHLSLALKSDGTVEAWGFNFYGGPNVPPDLTDAVAVSAGGGHDLALVGGGKVFLQNRLLSRTAVMSGATFFRIEATGAWPLFYQWRFNGTNLPGATKEVLALSNLQPSQAGMYSVWVYNNFGLVSSDAVGLTLLPLKTTQQPAGQTVPVGNTVSFTVAVQGLSPLVYQWRLNGGEITGATNSTLTLTNVQMSQAGAYSVVASNAHGSIVSSEATLTVVPILVTVQPQDRVSFLGGGAEFSAAAQGIAPINFQWQFNDVDLTGATNASLSLTNLGQDQTGRYSVTLSNVAGVVRSRDAALSVVRVAAWGDIAQASIPADLTNVIGIAAGLYHELALRADGLVTGWGAGGQVAVPAGLTNVVAVASGCYAEGSLALKDDGAVVIWGYNGYYGRPPPPSVSASLTNIVGASGGLSHLLALRADGTVVAWGDNSLGQATVPAGLSNVVAVSAGEAHSLALRTDGSVVAWGAGTPGAAPGGWNYGQSIVPIDLTNAIAIAGGALHSLALRADGRVAGWGYFGETNLPSNLTNVIAISAGEFHSLALMADGTVVGWGANWKGQTNVPVTLKNVAAIAAGGRHSIALVGDGPPVVQALLANPTWDSNGFRVFVPTQSGRVYRLEYKNSLTDSEWIGLSLVVGNGGIRILSDPTASGTQRFYQVRQW